MHRAVIPILLCLLALPHHAAAQAPDLSCPHPDGTAQVVIDPGHGKADPGAVNEAFGLWEKTLALEISRLVAETIEAEGYTVALTRDDNATALGNSDRGTIANACSAVVFVEIHLNASPDATVDYAQAYWGIKEKDLALAMTISESLNPIGIPVSAPARFDNGGLLRARMPSVLVETVFLSNPDEAQDLANGTRQAGIASAIASGILDWLDQYPHVTPAGQENAQ